MTSSRKHSSNLSLKTSAFIRNSFQYLACVLAGLVVHTQSASSQFFTTPQDLKNPSLGMNNSATMGSSITCPVPTFNMGAFGGSGENFANRNDLPASANGGAYNYGVSIGLSIPFGSPSSDFCKGFGKSRAAFERSRTENQLRNSQLSLVQQCYWLYTSGFLPKNKDLFKTNENFSSLRPCVDFSNDRSGTASIPGPPSTSGGETSESKTAPTSNTDTSEQPPQILIQDRRQ
jgi:hypothetical protein